MTETNRRLCLSHNSKPGVIFPTGSGVRHARASVSESRPPLPGEHTMAAQHPSILSTCMSRGREKGSCGLLWSLSKPFQGPLPRSTHLSLAKCAPWATPSSWRDWECEIQGFCVFQACIMEGRRQKGARPVGRIHAVGSQWSRRPGNPGSRAPERAALTLRLSCTTAVLVTPR